jgi:ketosteroid isomerase-like protein
MKTCLAFVFAAFLYASPTIFAQQQQPLPATLEERTRHTELLKEINRDIWVPFSEAIKTHDFELWMSFHSSDMIRGEGDRNKVSLIKTYSEQMKAGMARAKERGMKAALDFRFIQRSASAEAASERGVYQFTMVNDKGEKQFYYGKFHVFSRKESGRWKILVDYDSSEGGTINAASYQEAYALDDWGKY